MHEVLGSAHVHLLTETVRDQCYEHDFKGHCSVVISNSCHALYQTCDL